MLKYKAELTLNQLEALRDVLWKVDYKNGYNDELLELKQIFDFKKYDRFRKLCEGRE